MCGESEETKRVEKVTTAIRRLQIDGEKKKEGGDGRCPVYVTSSRKVHRSADGIISIIQEIFFNADGGDNSLVSKQLKEVHSETATKVRGRVSAETSARVFVGEKLIHMITSTSIPPYSSNYVEFDEVFHFAEHNEAHVVPVAFELTLERAEGEHPAVEFDLHSPIVVTLKQRIIKNHPRRAVQGAPGDRAAHQRFADSSDPGIR
ncbi:hypothetical protein PENTCL1PPCAC_16356 [Pristionchus entomophagus]|uniref:Uncharacterized protein n=1 Tax=Pristionchus entomophagus TaxID=358040 RepID=A0AAV5TIP5_9BILA|nr:hypothetical protein PENTCL1PPCAC_16356 [Pristionchus entomophagus]